MNGVPLLFVSAACCSWVAQEFQDETQGPPARPSRHMTTAWEAASQGLWRPGLLQFTGSRGQAPHASAADAVLNQTGPERLTQVVRAAAVAVSGLTGPCLKKQNPRSLTRWSGSMPLTSPGGLLMAPHVSSVSMPSSLSSSCRGERRKLASLSMH